MDGLLVAPTEPRQLKRIGLSSSVPESYGVDLLWSSETMGLCGAQRKEFMDLVASMNDGRLGKEVAQMEGKLGLKALVVEGRPKWGEDGALMSAYAKVTRPQIRSYLYTIRSKGVWVEVTDDLSDTIEVVKGMMAWSRKEKHSALAGRPGPTGGDWGQVGRREWAIHLLCGFEGIGPGVAEKIIEHFGKVPLQWTVTEKELREVDGIGKVRAKRLIQALEEVGDGDVAA